MTESAVCRKVASLLALYIDNKLDIETKEFVENHLQICPQCNEKYKLLKDLIFELRKAYNQIEIEPKNNMQTHFNIKEHENFQTNLSAYFDNELQLNESLTMKKYMIKYPKARKELESLYLLHNILNTSFNSTKKFFNNNYAKAICFRVQGKDYEKKKRLNLKIASYAVSVLIILSILIYSSPIGKTVINKGLEFFKKNVYVLAPVDNNVMGEAQ